MVIGGCQVDSQDIGTTLDRNQKVKCNIFRIVRD